MCGRFSLEVSPEEMAEAFPWLEDPGPRTARYNVAPSQPVAVITDRDPESVQAFRWGLIPRWAKEASIGNRLINARAETVDMKPAFRAAFKKRRCLLPASGFYEWSRTTDGKKQPHYLTSSQGRPLAFAGLWEGWNSPSGEQVYSCTIITTRPNQVVRPIHDRMPAILAAPDYLRWLSGDVSVQELLELAGEGLMSYPVSTLVNRPQNDSRECIEPLRGGS